MMTSWLLSRYREGWAMNAMYPKPAERTGQGVSLLLDAADRLALSVAAIESGMQQEEFVSALLAAHIKRAPRWNADVYRHLGDVGVAVRMLAAILPDLGPQAASRAVMG